MRLADLCASTWPVKVSFPSGTVTLNVRWERYDEGMYERLDALSVDEALLELVESWDLTEGEGKGEKPLPVTEEGLKQIPLPARHLMIQAALRAVRPNLTTPEA